MKITASIVTFNSVDEIEKRPNKRYETVVGAILTALVGGLIGYFVKMLGF